MVIRPAEDRDAHAWERMRDTLWPAGPGEHAGEIAAFFAGHRPNNEETLIAFDDSGQALGFVELAIRSYAEGCYAGLQRISKGGSSKNPPAEPAWVLRSSKHLRTGRGRRGARSSPQTRNSRMT